jgi:two-component system, cell cycle sensor histidine kinase and response regulator CckA
MTKFATTFMPQAKTTRTFMVWLLAIVLLLNLFVIGLAFVSLYQSRSQYVERASVQTQNLSQALVYSISGMMDTADVALLAIADEVERARLLGRDEAASMNAIIARQHARLPELDSLRVTDAQGKVLYGTGVVPGSAVSAADRDYFLKLKNDPRAGFVISQPVLGRISGKWVLIVARRVNNPDGSFGGVVYGPIDLERIRAVLASIDVGRGGRITLRDRDLKVIVRHPEAEGIGNQIGSKPTSQELLGISASGKQSATFFTPTSSDATARLVSYRAIAKYPLSITVSLSTSEYLAPWMRDLSRMSALVALFVAVTVVLSRLVFLKWLREREAQDSLRKSKDDLELRVTVRTAELYKANSLLIKELAERERAEDELRRGRNMLAQIIDAIPQSVFWKDRDSVYLGCNIVFARAGGLERSADVVGKTDYDLPWLTEESDGYRRDDRAVMDSNHPKYHIIEQQQQASGERIWVDTTKIPLCNEAGKIYGVLGIYDNITERKVVEESRNKALAFIESLLAATPAGILVYDGESGNCVMANKSVAEMVGTTIEELRGQNFREIGSWQEAGIDLIAEDVLVDSVTRHVEKSVRTTFGNSIEIDCFFSRFDVEATPHLMFITVDISEKKRLEQENRQIEAQMLHVQKLESLGVLAGGIAHDFNNILMVVLGNADLALMRLAPNSPAHDNLVQIESAACRAADLARQMLAYSGKGRFVIENLDLTKIVEEMAQMLEVSISKKVVLSYNFAPYLPSASGDATQLRQVILNLVINASEAIGDQPGVISIRTSSIMCDRAYLADIWINDRLDEGEYLVLEVTDTGCGMDREVIEKIFDPFFTTKFTGRGLGMAAVLGIVRGHKGAMTIYSEKGKGSTFRLLLPAVRGAADQQVSHPLAEQLWRGSGTVLLVDDEEIIRTLGQDMLQELGFNVLTAADGVEAIEVFSNNAEQIDCVLLDLTMPHLDGEQTFRELRRIKPEVKVVISSGYNEAEVSQKFIGKGEVGFIQKPYKLVEMSKKLQGVLG